MRREADRIQPKILKGIPTGPERYMKPHIESHRYSVKVGVRSKALIYTGCVAFGAYGFNSSRRLMGPFLILMVMFDCDRKVTRGRQKAWGVTQ